MQTIEVTNCAEWQKELADFGHYKIPFAYRFINGDFQIKLLNKYPKGIYYSFLNDAGNYFDEKIKPSLIK